MKRTVIKITVFLLTFLVSVIVIGKVMYQGHNNMTMEIAPASLPLMTMGTDDISYNQLHGYTQEMDVAFQRDTITVLGENRNTQFAVDTFGRNVTSIRIEVRSTDGSRLIEDTPITDYRREEQILKGEFALKDLIEKNTEYSLTVVLELDEEQEVYYYTRAIWGDSFYTAEKLSFVKDFHEKLYDKEAAGELTKYLETNSRLEDNSSFHKVNIHSSFQQITWGNLNITEVSEPVFRLTEIASQTASFLVDYVVADAEGRTLNYYQVQEFYRIRYTSDRVYLLDYERTMTQIPEAGRMYANDKLLLGIADEQVPMLESEDGNIVVFETANRLYSYNVTNNSLAVIFSFYDKDNGDERTLWNQHSIKILDVNEGGNVTFAVYGYMNRGRYEGQTGVQVYVYNGMLNTIEESVYIPYTKGYAMLKAQMDQLLYLNRSRQMYVLLDSKVYEVDLEQQSLKVLVEIIQDDSLQVAENHRLIVWQEQNESAQNTIYHCRRLNVRNLSNGIESVIDAGEGEAIRPLGFMGEDIIYGVARESDIVEENSGRIFFPMYKICISNAAGNLLKEYSQEGLYVTECSIVDNQITLTRLARSESGLYTETTPEHIMNNIEQVKSKNFIAATDTDIYKRYVQIQIRTAIDNKSIKILTPKEVVFEGGRKLALPEEEETVSRYYVYGPYGVDGIYYEPAKAVNLAYEISGVVVNESGDLIWLKGNRFTRNQIMAITGDSVSEDKNSLAVCLDTILELEGIVRNSNNLLSQGQTVMEILSENLEDTRILDLTGCPLDAVLYYVNQDIPVLAMLENGEAVLVTGFNELNIVVMEPTAATPLYKKGMNDSAEWLEENGNCFVTYIPEE